MGRCPTTLTPPQLPVPPKVTRDKTKGAPPFDRQQIMQEALSMIARYGGKKEAERAAMSWQAGNGPSTPGIYSGRSANAIRKMK